MREAIFSRLGHRVSQARVADLYAGTGSYGLEALSRGATQVHFLKKISRPSLLGAQLQTGHQERRI